MKKLRNLITGSVLLLATLCLCSCADKTENKKREFYKTMLAPTQQKTAVLVDWNTDSDKIKKIENEIAKQEFAGDTDKAEKAIRFIDTSSTSIQSRISSTGLLKFVDRTKMDDIMKEHHFQNNAFSSTSKTAEIGKALNASYIVYIEYNSYKNDHGKVFGMVPDDIENCVLEVSIFNINTMKKVSWNDKCFPRTYSSASPESSGIPDEFFNFFENDRSELNGKWMYDGIKITSIEYKKNQLELITPFASTGKLSPYKVNKKLKKIKKNKFNIDYESGISLEISDDKCLIDGRNAKLVFSKKESFMYPTGKVSLDSSFKLVQNNSSYYGNNLFGSISIREDNMSPISGDAYLYGDQLGIYLGSDKDDGTGRAYFMMFTRE